MADSNNSVIYVIYATEHQCLVVAQQFANCLLGLSTRTLRYKNIWISFINYIVVCSAFTDCCPSSSLPTSFLAKLSLVDLEILLSWLNSLLEKYKTKIFYTRTFRIPTCISWILNLVRELWGSCRLWTFFGFWSFFVHFSPWILSCSWFF